MPANQRILPLPGNSSREGSFYEEQRPANPPSITDWPGPSEFALAAPEETGTPNPMPFVLENR